MSVLKKLVAAKIVRDAYIQMGYFSRWNPLPFFSVLYDYYSLRAEVAFAEDKDSGQYVGTIMMALDRGPGSVPQLDQNFPHEMAKIRNDFPPGADGKATIATCGKFGKVLGAKSSTTALRCFLKVVDFAAKNNVKVIVFVVNPNQESPYKKMGGKVVASVRTMKGLKDAPGQLIRIVLSECPVIMRRINERNQDAHQSTPQGVAA